VKQQHTSTATSILTTKSTYRNLSAQRLSERTVYANSKPRPILMKRKTVLASGHSEYKHRQRFNTDFTGKLIICQETNFTFEITVIRQTNLSQNSHFAVIFFLLKTN
jgi:hypothetical protein